MAAKTLVSKLSFVAAPRSIARSSPFLRLRPLLAVSGNPSSYAARGSGVAAARCFSSRPTTSSLNDPSPNWSNRPPKETILLDGCDFEHWLVVMEPPKPEMTRDDIIDMYIKTLVEVVGSEQEARKSIYSVSTKHYFAFGCIVSEETSYKIKTLPNVRWVLPDSYLDVKNKDYGGEPFIDGQAVPYDPKYHEEWVKNNARAMERNRRNDRPRNFDRSRNFDRRRENAQNFQNRDAPPMPNQGGMQSQAPPMQSSSQSPPHSVNSGPPGGAPNYQNQSVNSAPSGGVPNYQSQGPNAQGFAPNARSGYQGNAQGYQGGGGPGYQGNGYQGNGQSYQGGNAGYQSSGPGYQGGSQGPNPGYQGGPAGYNQQGGHPGYQGSSAGYNPQGQSGGYQGGNPNVGGYQGGAPSYQQSNDGGYQAGGYQGGNPNYQQSPSFQGRDIPGRDQ